MLRVWRLWVVDQNGLLANVPILSFWLCRQSTGMFRVHAAHDRSSVNAARLGGYGLAMGGPRSHGLDRHVAAERQAL